MRYIHGGELDSCIIADRIDLTGKAEEGKKQSN